MFNEKIARLAKALTDDLTLRLASAANPNPVAVGYDSNQDLYLTVTDQPGSQAIVKFETDAALAAGAKDSLGLSQSVYTPHITKLGLDEGAAATDTATLNAVVATNTLTVNGVVFTAVAAGAVGNQFNVGANDTATAANLAAAINASVTSGVAGVVSATSVGAVVTVFADVPGAQGNLLTLAGTALRFTIGGATFSGGANPGTSENLEHIMVASCAPTSTALYVYAKASIGVADMAGGTNLVTVIRNIPWGLLAQV